MRNPFQNRVAGVAGPARDILPVTPNDANDLSEVAVALYVEVAGTVRFATERGEIRTISLPDMSLLPVGVRRVFSTGTTASGIHGLVV